MTRALLRAKPQGMRYRDAGVDIDAGEELVRRIAPLARATRTPEVLADVGGFAGLCGLPAGMRDPVLVSGTDGVGTKLKVAFATGVHDTVGIDLVAMCVNDIVTTGARPLFFLDYFASAKLDVNVGEAVVRGIAEGCRRAECALLGGETAELPGMYHEGEYDLAGFAVGVVERSRILDGTQAKEGDVLVAMASSGLHSNGYSLARRVIEHMGLGYDDELAGKRLRELLLEPTRIYVRPVRALLDACGSAVHGLAHITGGGLTDNVPRVLSDDLAAEIELSSYARPPLFEALAHGGSIDEDEMRRTFNLGVGMVLVIDAAEVEHALEVLEGTGERVWRLGKVTARAGEPVRYRVS